MVSKSPSSTQITTTREAIMTDDEDDEIKERFPFKLVSIPDGMGPEDDRNDIPKLCLAMLGTMYPEFQKLLEENIVQGGDDRITCVADPGF
ncbi:hypothetical protein K1719_036384 [Acacia pycnantha]|nr:hypothetical protein K1719_036384 [Acacia pycnantha]